MINEKSIENVAIDPLLQLVKTYFDSHATNRKEIQCSSNTKMPVDISLRKEVRLEPFKQQHNWDCGITCCWMIINHIHNKKDNINKSITRGANQITVEATKDIPGVFEAGNISLNEVMKLANTKETWTVDLAYILHQCNIKVAYLTSSVGINENLLKTLNFYKNTSQHEQQRIKRRFQYLINAERIFIKSAQLSIDLWPEFLDTGKYCIIALIDKRYLTPFYTSNEASPICTFLLTARKWFFGSFIGHYILITGYIRNTAHSKNNANSKTAFIYHDPSTLNSNGLYIYKDDLFRAFNRHGTDHDMLIVKL
jgi:hypothetical protein